MIESVRGELLYTTAETAVVECGGIGYAVFMTQTALASLPASGCEVRLCTHMAVSEDAIRLFGFLTRDELETFRLLIGVSGIGPKSALGILSVLPPDDLRFAVLADDVKALCQAPGVGKKGAQKLILELKDKMKLDDAFEKRRENASSGTVPSGQADSVTGDAIQALVSLGYSSSEAMKTVRSLTLPEDADVETVISEALMKLSMF